MATKSVRRNKRWESVITHVPGGGAPGYPAGELTIKCNLNYIDGPDGVLGAAGPEGIWEAYPGISYEGTMVREKGGTLEYCGQPGARLSFVERVHVAPALPAIVVAASSLAGDGFVGCCRRRGPG